MKGKIHVDSSEAIGKAHRRGNGKFGHVKVGSLWIQDLVEEEEILISARALKTLQTFSQSM